LKLPYNVTQNPYEAATKFLTDNELPADYLEEVTNFIIKNTQGAQLGGQAEGPPGLDPMGTESRYRPGDVSTYQPTRAAQKKLPVRYCIAITAGKPDAALRQIVKLNAQYETKDMALTPTELDSLSSLVDRLKTYDFSKPASLSLTTLLDSVTSALLKAGTQWEPPSNRLAGLDLFRLLAVSVTSFPIDPVEAVLTSGAFAAGNSKLAMMAIRFFLNLVYGSPAGRTLFANHLDAIAKAVKSATPLATTDASLAMQLQPSSSNSPSSSLHPNKPQPNISTTVSQSWNNCENSSPPSRKSNINPAAMSCNKRPNQHSEASWHSEL